jgi:hypothetical protein
MRSFIILFATIILFCKPCFSQTKAKITDVDFQLEDRYLVVNYNITGALPKEQMTIQLKFINEKNEEIIPKTVTGDVGTKFYTDGMKAILWDIVADQVLLSGNLKASVTITYSKIIYSGPSNAFLSVLIPGLGGYFVDKHKARAVLTTISTVGLLAYGFTQKLQSDKSYKEYGASKVPADIQSSYDKANGAHKNYLNAVRIGAGLWAFDIFCVTIRGIHNKKDAKSAYTSFSNDGLRLYHVNNGLQLGYSVSF